tara:strand:+ start:280 stop:606 length:327 start_codon:yes stop_codon:yes gene_type:complete
MASAQNLVIDQGTTFSVTINVAADDGSALDLSDYTVSAQIRKSYHTNTYTAFTTAKVNLTGEITLSLTATQTSALKYGRYVYDLEIASSSETVRVIEGIITVTPEVTR